MTPAFAARLSILVASITFGSAASAAIAPGGGTLSGPERLSVAGCGKDSGGSNVLFTIASDGTWSAIVDGNTYQGTSTANGNGRFSRLSMDGNSFALFTQVLTAGASDLCADVVTVTGVSITKSLLKVNKRLTAAKLEIQAVASGSAGGNSGRGKYMLKASGGWQVP